MSLKYLDFEMCVPYEERNNLREHFIFNPDRFHWISCVPQPSKPNLYKT